MISVVIPTLNESRCLPVLLSCLSGCATDYEVIVCDGGSTDNTRAIAESFGVTVITAGTGRGVQLAAGASLAKGEILLFLHADSDLQPGCLAAIERVLSNRPEVIGGNFRVLFDQDSLFCRFIEHLCATLRKFGLYYGDSGIFVRRRVYDAIGGFKGIAIMEDVDLVLRLEKYGKTCCIAETPLRTSTRRFKRRSALDLVLLWMRMHLLFALGASDSHLAKVYEARSTDAGEEADW